MRCSQYPHVLSCGPKVRAREDKKLKQWKEDEELISSIRDSLLKDREQREREGDIRMFPNNENRRHLEETNPQDPVNQTILQDERAIELFSDNPSSALLDSS